MSRLQFSKYTVMVITTSLVNGKILSLYASNEPRHEISNNVVHVCTTSKGSDQPVHMRSLIRAFTSPLHIL